MYSQSSKSPRHKGGSLPQGYGSPSKGGHEGSYLTPSPHRQTTGYGSPGGHPDLSPAGQSGMDMIGSAPSPISKSPYQSPSHSRSSSLSSVRSSLRDRDNTRSLERGLTGNVHKPETTELTVHQHLSLVNSVRSGSSNRDRSLDRQLQREREAERYHTYSGRSRDKSLDRDYPHMGAKSLERDYQSTNLVRSRSIDYDYVNSQAAFLPPSMDFRSSDTLILDLQTKIAELNKECAILQQDLDHTKEKLASSMNSIKTFWSPELKKERSMRKEESAKNFNICEQVKMLQAENRKQSHMIREFDQQNGGSIHGGMDHSFGSPRHATATSVFQDHIDILQQEKDRQTKEVLILRKTISEMELRIDTQKQTMEAKEESIKKLLAMVQSKDVAAKSHELEQREVDKLREQFAEYEQKTKQLEGLLDQKDAMIQQVKKSLSSSNNQKCDEYEDVIKTKNIQVDALQVKIQNLREQLQTKGDHMATLEVNQEQLHQQLDSLTEQNKTFKNKCEELSKDVQTRGQQVQSLQSTLQSYEQSRAEMDRSSGTLREQLDAKLSEFATLQARAQHLEQTVKNLTSEVQQAKSQVSSLTNQRQQLQGQLAEHQSVQQDRLDEVKILQKRNATLEGTVKDSDTKMTSFQSKITALQSDNKQLETTISQLKETLHKQKQAIDKLNEDKSKQEADFQKQLSGQGQTSQQLQSRNKQLQAHFDQAQLELKKQKAAAETMQEVLQEQKGEIDRLNSESTKQEIDLKKQLQAQTQAKQDLHGKVQELHRQFEVAEEAQRKQYQATTAERESSAKREERLQTEAEKYKTQSERASAETDRLLSILEQSELEKRDLDKEIKKLQSQVKDYKQKIGGSHSDGSGRGGEEFNLKSVVEDKNDRIEELEEALRESVKITAQRELMMVQQQDHIDMAEKQMEYLHEEMEKVRDQEVNHTKKMSDLQLQIDARDKQLKLLQGDRGKQMSELYEMKQEALSAAITEKDAHIALLEIAPNKKTENIDAVERLTKEKIFLQQQLKDLTEKRMKLLGLGNNTDKYS